MSSKKHISREGQDLLDAILQNYGTLEGGLQDLIRLNPALDLGVDLTSGQEIIIDPVNLGDINTKDFFLNNLSVLNNADGQFIPELGNYDFQDESDYDFQDGTFYDFN